MTQTERRCNR